MTHRPKLLFIGNSILGWSTYTDQLSRAIAGRDDLSATTLSRRPSRLATIMVKRHDMPDTLARHIRQVDPIHAYRGWLGREIRRTIRRHRPDIVHFAAHWPAGAILDMPDRPPFTLSLDCTRDNIERDFGYGIWNAVDLRLEASLLGQAARLYPMSTWAANSLHRNYALPQSNIRIVRSGQDMSQFKPVVPHNGPPNILFIGNDFIRKGGDKLAQWVTGPLAGTCHLHIVSCDPAAKLSGPGITFHGRVPHAELVRQLMPQMDMLCLPTQLDMSPHVLVEAAAAGLPSVSSELGGIGDIVLQGKTGLLLPPEDDAGFISALRTLISSPDLRRSMGATARQYAAKNFDVSRNMNDMLDDIINIANSNK